MIGRRSWKGFAEVLEDEINDVKIHDLCQHTLKKLINGFPVSRSPHNVLYQNLLESTTYLSKGSLYLLKLHLLAEG